MNYTITYTEVPSGNSRKEIVIAPSRNVTLTGLKIFTNYSITVFASTAKGGGNRSVPIIVTTDEDRKYNSGVYLIYISFRSLGYKLKISSAFKSCFSSTFYS